jgi:NitT/TauT family transport system substrate-binding protein
VAVLLAALTLSAGLAACSPGVRDAPLQLAANRYWPGYGPIFLAQDLGYLHPDRVVVNEMPSTTDVIASWRNRSIDLAALTLDEALMLAETRDDVRILFVADISMGGDAVIAKPTIERIEDLRGKRIGVESTAVGAYILSRALETGHLTTRDVTIVPLTVDLQHSAFANGEVDALVTYEPLVTLLEQEGARRLFDTAQIPGEVVDVMVVRQDVLESRPEDVANITDAWFRAVETFERESDTALSTMAVRSGVTAEVFMISMKGILVPDRAESDQLISGDAPGLLGPARRLVEVMRSAELLNSSIDPAELLIEGTFER